MGTGSSKSCSPLKSDAFSVVTLSDSCVKRLPIARDEGPLEREAREKNIDDFWKERLVCLEKAYYDSLHVTEEELARLEKTIMSVAPKDVKVCQFGKESLITCMGVFEGEPTKCSHIVKKVEKCVDTKTMNATRNIYLDWLRQQRKKVC